MLQECNLAKDLRLVNVKGMLLSVLPIEMKHRMLLAYSMVMDLEI